MTTHTRSTRASVARALERDVLAGCLEACRALGVPVQRQNTGAMEVDGRRVRFGRKGNADITGTIPARPGTDPGKNAGKRIEIEVKRPGERPRPEQLERLAEARAAGAIAFWVTDAKDCLNVLRRVLEGGWIEVDDETGEQWVVWSEDL